MKEGSITVFFCLFMVVCLGITGALLEGSRLYGARAVFTMCCKTASDSVQASYNRELWEKYGLLLWDGEAGADNQELLAEEYEEWLGEELAPAWYGLYLYGMSVEQVKVKEYHTLLEDGGIYMLQQMLDAEERDSSSILLEYMNELIAFLPSISLPDSGFSLDALLEKFTVWAVLPKDTVVSAYEIAQENLPSAELSYGCRETVLEKLLANQYIIEQFDSYTDGRKEGVCYQIEYILNGAEEDSLNLVSAARKLIHFRTGLNFIKILSEGSMQEVADAAAALIAAALTIPEAQEIVKLLVEAAWAYGEAIQDVQDLYEGKCIPLQKETSDWHLWIHPPEQFTRELPPVDLGSVGSVIEDWLESREKEETVQSQEQTEADREKTVMECLADGKWNYECYLYLLLYFLNPKLQLGRTMDLIQVELSQKYPWFSLGNCCAGFTLETEAYIKPVFSSLSIQSGIRFGGKILVEETTVRFSDGLQGI